MSRVMNNSTKNAVNELAIKAKSKKENQKLRHHKYELKQQRKFRQRLNHYIISHWLIPKFRDDKVVTYKHDFYRVRFAKKYHIVEPVRRYKSMASMKEHLLGKTVRGKQRNYRDISFSNDHYTILGTPSHFYGRMARIKLGFYGVIHRKGDIVMVRAHNLEEFMEVYKPLLRAMPNLARDNSINNLRQKSLASGERSLSSAKASLSNTKSSMASSASSSASSKIDSYEQSNSYAKIFRDTSLSTDKSSMASSASTSASNYIESYKQSVSKSQAESDLHDSKIMDDLSKSASSAYDEATSYRAKANSAQSTATSVYSDAISCNADAVVARSTASSASRSASQAVSAKADNYVRDYNALSESDSIARYSISEADRITRSNFCSKADRSASQSASQSASEWVTSVSNSISYIAVRNGDISLLSSKASSAKGRASKYRNKYRKYKKCTDEYQSECLSIYKNLKAVVASNEELRKCVKTVFKDDKHISKRYLKVYGDNVKLSQGIKSACHMINQLTPHYKTYRKPLKNGQIKNAVRNFHIMMANLGAMERASDSVQHHFIGDECSSSIINFILNSNQSGDITFLRNIARICTNELNSMKCNQKH